MQRRPRRFMFPGARRPFIVVPLPVGAGLPEGARQELVRAHELMETGQYAQAAQIFSRLAEAAREAGRPRAAQLYLQAGRATLSSGKTEEGTALLREGLQLLAEMQRWGVLAAVGPRIVARLSERGLKEQAEGLSAWLKSALAGAPAAARLAAGRAATAALPTKCTHCGGTLRSDEVEWIDSLTAECPYCGSAVRAT